MNSAYFVFPKTTFDFMTENLDARITFTRAANTATRINGSGYIESANENVARFDYDPVTLAIRGLLIEESRSNVIKQSSQFEDAVWVKSNCSVSNNVVGIIAPDGAQTADKVIENSANASHVIYQDFAAPAGNVTYSLSFFAKAAERSVVVVTFSGINRTFNLTNGSISGGGGASIAAWGNGWYRCVITSTIPDTVMRSYGVFLSNGSTTDYQGDGVSGVYLWGAQLEQGSFPTSHIPTTSVAATRNADNATVTGANFSSWWQATKGGAVVRARPGAVSGTRPWVQFDDGTADNIIALRGNTTNPELYIKATTDQAQIDAGTIAVNTPYALTGVWDTNNCAARLDAGTAVFDASATIPVVTQARLGSDGTNYLNGHLELFNFYDQFYRYIYTRRKNKAVFSLL